MSDAKARKVQPKGILSRPEDFAKQWEINLVQAYKEKEYVERLLQVAENETKDPVAHWRKLTGVYDHLLASVPLQETTLYFQINDIDAADSDSERKMSLGVRTFYLYTIENALRKIENKLAQTLTDPSILIEVGKKKMSRFMDGWFMQVVADNDLLRQYPWGLQNVENLDLYDLYAKRVSNDLKILEAIKKNAKRYTTDVNVKTQLQQDINLLSNRRLLFLNPTFYKPLMEGLQLRTINFTKANILLSNALSAMTRLEAQDDELGSKLQVLITATQQEMKSWKNSKTPDAKSVNPKEIKFSAEQKVIIIKESEGDQDTQEQPQQKKLDRG